MNDGKRLVAVIAGSALAAGLAWAGEAGLDDSQMGLAGSVFDIEEPSGFEYISTDPEGEVTLLPTAFEEAPPQIPHTLEKMVPITLKKNGCLKCHDDQDLWGKEKDPQEPSPMPKSHYVDLHRAPDLVHDKVLGSRYFCLQCHVPQAEVALLIDNDF